MTNEPCRRSPDLEIQQYLHRFERMTAEELLELMGQLREFFWEHMTPDGRKFLESRQNDLLGRFLSEANMQARE